MSGAPSRTTQPPHFHDEYLLCAQLRGHEQCHVGGTLHRFVPGDVVLINPQQVHTGNTRGDEIEYISLYVDRGVVRRFAEDVGAPNALPEFTSLRTKGQRELSRSITELLARVQGEGLARARRRGAPSSDDLAAAMEIDAALQRVLEQAFERFSNLRLPERPSTARVGHQKIARVIEYLRDLPPNTTPEDASLDRLAEEAELSKYHVVRQFQRSVGMTPGAYLRTLRLCHAARLLRRRADPIVDIAAAVGFSDHPSFSRAFARHMGMTPSQYRALGPL